MSNDVAMVEPKFYKKKSHVPVQAIKFTGGAESADAINAFLKKETELTAVWYPARAAVLNKRNEVIRLGREEHLVVRVGNSHTIVMDVDDYMVIKDEDPFGIETSGMYQDRYEEVA